MASLNVNAFGSSYFENKNNLVGLTKHEANEVYVNVSGDYMSGILNMKNNQIKNLAIPTDRNDAVSKKYVDDSKHKMNTSLNMNDNQIKNVKIPMDDNDVANKIYVDISKHMMNGNLDMNNKQIRNLATPTDEKDVTNKVYVDSTKHIMNGNLDMNNNRLCRLSNPKENLDAMNLQTFTNYYHTLLNLVLKLDGTNKMLNNFDMNNKHIVNLGDPVNDKDAVNRAFMDLKLGDISGKIDVVRREILQSAEFIAKALEQKVLLLDGTTKPTTSINMDGFKIVNAGYPEYHTDLSTKQYVDDQITRAKSHVFFDRNRGSAKSWQLVDIGFTAMFNGKITKMSLRCKNPQDEQANVFLRINKINKTEYNVTLNVGMTHNLIDFSANPLIVNEKDQIEFSDEDKLQAGTVCQILIEN